MLRAGWGPALLGAEGGRESCGAAAAARGAAGRELGWVALVRSVGGGARWQTRTRPQHFLFRDYCVLLCPELR